MFERGTVPRRKHKIWTVRQEFEKGMGESAWAGVSF